MSKLKERFVSLIQILKKSLEKFPITIVPIMILTVIYAINLDNDFINDDILEKISFFILAFSSGAFLVETLKDKTLVHKIWYYIAVGIIATFFTWGVIYKSSTYILRLFISYLIITWVLGIYYCYKKTGKTFEEYVTKTFISIFKTTLIYGIFAIGLAIVTAIFVYLILGGKSYSLVFRIEILLTGIYYLPTIIYNLYDQKDEVGKFAKVVIKYVLGTLVMIAFTIIYIYIIKIILLRKIPSNQIFRILTALFVIGFPIWTMVSYFKEDSLFDKINSKLPYLFTPFIFLQIYAIGVRIASNGITISRYLCVMVIVFEIIYIFMYLKNQEEVGKVLWVFTALALISIICPYINMYNVSNKSQQSIMRIYTKKANLSNEEISKAYGGYKYLKYSEYGDKYISDEDKKFIDEIEKNNDMNDMINITGGVYEKTIYGSKNITEIDVEGYKKVHEIGLYDYDVSEGKTIDDVFSELEIEEGKKIDISSKIKEYLEHKDNLEDYFEKESEIIINNSEKLILENFSIRYNENTKDVYIYSMSGYLLEK